MAIEKVAYDMQRVRLKLEWPETNWGACINPRAKRKECEYFSAHEVGEEAEVGSGLVEIEDPLSYLGKVV